MIHIFGKQPPGLRDLLHLTQLGAKTRDAAHRFVIVKGVITPPGQARSHPVYPLAPPGVLANP
jgi:hypothetical protein